MDSLKLLKLGRLVDNFEEDATGATAKWPDTTHYKAEVPLGKRWFLLYGSFYRDANQTANVQILNAADKTVGYLGSYGATTGIAGYPLYSSTSVPECIILDAGWYIYITFGGAQGANAYATAVVIEVQML